MLGFVLINVSYWRNHLMENKGREVRIVARVTYRNIAYYCALCRCKLKLDDEIETVEKRYVICPDCGAANITYKVL